MDDRYSADSTDLKSLTGHIAAQKSGASLHQMAVFSNLDDYRMAEIVDSE